MADKIIPAQTIKEPFVEAVDSAQRIELRFIWQRFQKPDLSYAYRKDVIIEVQHLDGQTSSASDTGNDIPDTVKNKCKAAAEEYLALVKPRMGF